MATSPGPAHQLDERDLLARLRAGDARAFETLYSLYYERLVAFASAIIRDQDAARDVVSDFLIALWGKRDQWEPPASLKSYLFGAVQNRAFNHLRSVQREGGRLDRVLAGGDVPGMGEPADAPDALLVAPLDREATLWSAVARLNERARTVVALRWQEQMPHAEIARTLGVSEDAVKKIHQRALATLARLLPDLVE